MLDAARGPPASRHVTELERRKKPTKINNLQISFKDLESTDGPRGTKAGQHELSTHSQWHISKLILKSLLDNTSNLPGTRDEKVVLPLVRTHASIIAGSAPNAARPS